MSNTIKNYDRLNQTKEQLKTLLTLLDSIENGSSTIKDAANTLGLSPQAMNRELSNAFCYYFKSRVRNISTEDITTIIDHIEKPSEKLLRKIFEIENGNYVVYPNYDEDYFWNTAKDMLSKNGYTILTKKFGYNTDLVDNNEIIGKSLGLTRARVGQIYNASINKLKSSVFISLVFTTDTILAIKDIHKQIVEKEKEYEIAYNKLINMTEVIEKASNSDEIITYINKNYPSTVDTLSFISKDVENKLNSSIDTIKFSNRTQNALHRAGIHTIFDIIDPTRVNKTIAEVCNIKGLGNKSISEIIFKLDELFGYTSIWSNTRRLMINEVLQNIK